MKFVIPVLASFMTMSISNRRIEVCCILRRQAANWWINVFKDLFNDADLLHVEGIRYCFMDVLQKQLTRVVIQSDKNNMQLEEKPYICFCIWCLYIVRDYKVGCAQYDILYVLFRQTQPKIKYLSTSRKPVYIKTNREVMTHIHLTHISISY
jgi:hypothetical protein